MAENQALETPVPETPPPEAPKKPAITKFCCNSGEDTNTKDEAGNPIKIGKKCKPTTSGACFSMGWNKKFIIKCDSETIKKKLKNSEKKPPLSIKTGAICKHIEKDTPDKSGPSGDANGMNTADDIGLANDAIGMGGRRKNKSKKKSIRRRKKKSTKRRKRKYTKRRK